MLYIIFNVVVFEANGVLMREQLLVGRGGSAWRLTRGAAPNRRGVGWAGLGSKVGSYILNNIKRKVASLLDVK